MQDIMELLRQAAAGLDGIAVRGMADREMLSSCVRGIQSAVAGLEAIQAAQYGTERTGQGPETEENSEVNEHNG